MIHSIFSVKRAVRLENGMTILLVSDLKDEANQEGGDGVENKSEKLVSFLFDS